VRVGWANVHARGAGDRDIADIYLRQSGLLDWKFDEVADAPVTERENPLERQQREYD